MNKSCLNCKKPLTSKQKQNIFCSRTCAAKYNNPRRVLDHTKSKTLPCHICGKPVFTNMHSAIASCEKHKKKRTHNYNSAKAKLRYLERKKQSPKTCKFCGKVVVYNFCNSVCFAAYQKLQKFAEIARAGVLPASMNTGLARKYMVHTFGHKCQICGNTEWQGKPIPLVLDHIDGNSDNNVITNCRLVCRNCDGLLPTFAGRNCKKGRKTKRMQYRVEYYKKYGV